MTKNVLDYLCKCSGWLTNLFNIHLDAVSMSQHKLCDEIQEELTSFRDTVAEISQGINGRIGNNKLKEIKSSASQLEILLNDILKETLAFYKKLDGDDNIGLRSETESFIGKIYRFLYLNDVCLKKQATEIKENKNNIHNIVNECIHSYIKNIING